MSEICAIVEGPTEQNFIKEILAPALGKSGVFLCAAILRKPGENGGDVKFSRVQNDIGKFLKQRPDIRVTLMLDYYGIHDTENDVWPGYKRSKEEPTHLRKHSLLIEKTMAEILRRFPEQDPQSRFIPYFSMHEIESLYFCSPDILSQQLGIERTKIDTILDECGEPEKINDDRATAPSKRLKTLSPHFRKISTGLKIAHAIGIPAMRNKCPLFNAWVAQLECQG